MLFAMGLGHHDHPNPHAVPAHCGTHHTTVHRLVTATNMAAAIPNPTDLTSPNFACLEPRLGRRLAGHGRQGCRGSLPAHPRQRLRRVGFSGGRSFQTDLVRAVGRGATTPISRIASTQTSLTRSAWAGASSWPTTVRKPSREHEKAPRRISWCAWNSLGPTGSSR
jgi:hypothetical protein